MSPRNRPITTARLPTKTPKHDHLDHLEPAGPTFRSVPACLVASLPRCLHGPSYNQVAKRGVSIFGALSPFESQPPNEAIIGCTNRISKILAPLITSPGSRSAPSLRRFVAYLPRIKETDSSKPLDVERVDRAVAVCIAGALAASPRLLAETLEYRCVCPGCTRKQPK